MPQLNPLLSLLELPSATSFYDQSQSSVPHEPGSTFANLNNSSLPNSRESNMGTSAVKINLQHELPCEIPSHISIKIQEMDSKFITLGLGGDCWPKSSSPTEELCVLCGATPWTKGRRVRLSSYQLCSSGAN